MRLSDIITQMIQQMISEADGIAEIQRNEMASRIGCVPSQINYVITSRFTPEQGYIVESRRGGGGYIRITQVKLGRKDGLMHVINCVGRQIDSESVRIFLKNLQDNGVVSPENARMMGAALSDSVYGDIPQELRDRLRATIFKRMLATLLR